MTEVAMYDDRAPVHAAPFTPAATHHLAALATDIDSWTLVISDIIKLANVICETEFVPKNYRGNGPATAAAILAGRELDLPPMTALRHVHVVEGAPSLSAEYKRARVLAAGHEFDIVELSITRCRVAGRRRGSGKPPLEITFTMEDAKRAGLVKSRGAWETRPRRMLFARAGTELCDFLFADVTNGLPTAELVAAGDSEDEFAGYNESPGQASPGNGHAPPAKPAAKTAQRRARQAPTAAAGADAAPPAAAPATAQTAPADAGLPPLPGEEEPGPTQPGSSSAGPNHPPQETSPSSASSPSSSGTEPDLTDYDTPGTVTTPQLTAIWTVFRQVFGFTAEEKDHARSVAAHIIGRPLASTKDMSRNEAKAVLDTLGNWQAIAEQRGESPREVLVAMMAASEGAGDG